MKINDVQISFELNFEEFSHVNMYAPATSKITCILLDIMRDLV